MNYVLYLYEQVGGENKYREPIHIEDLDKAIAQAVEEAGKRPQIGVTSGGDQMILDIVEGHVRTFDYPVASEEARKMVETLPLFAPFTCPTCKKKYVPCLPVRHGEAWKREQHLSHICSQECWNKGLGLPADTKSLP